MEQGLQEPNLVREVKAPTAFQAMASAALPLSRMNPAFAAA